MSSLKTVQLLNRVKELKQIDVAISLLAEIVLSYSHDNL